MKLISKYAGSKRRILENYGSLFIPANKFDCFVDMFAGGLAVSAFIRKHFPNVRIIANDNNKELMFMYSQLRNNTDDFIKTFQDIEKTYLALPAGPRGPRKEFYYSVRNKYLFDNTKTPVEEAVYLLFMLKTCFNGIWRAYAFADFRFSAAAGEGKEKSLGSQNLLEFADFLKTIELVDDDWKNVPYSNTTFFYADPPYFDTSINYESNNDRPFQLDLLDYLNDRANEGHLVATSNYEMTETLWNKHLPSCSIQKIDISHNAKRGTTKAKTTEVLVRNF